MYQNQQQMYQGQQQYPQQQPYPQQLPPAGYSQPQQSPQTPPPQPQQQQGQYGGQQQQQPMPVQQAIVQQQQQQQQGPQQQQGQQNQQQPQQAQAQGQNQQSKPGFFGRLFGGGAASTNPQAGGAQQAPPGQPGSPQTQNQQQQQQQVPGAPNGAQQQAAPVAEAPRSAACLPSKPLPADQVQEIQGRPVAPSRFKCLNKDGVAGAPAGPQQMPGVMPGMGPGARPPMVTPSITGPAPEVSKYGPYLRFGGYDPMTRQYKASVLYIVHQARSPKPPVLRFMDVDVPGSETPVQATHLDHYQGWNFWRFDLIVECGATQRTVEYFVVNSTDHTFTHYQRHRFFVPGVGQKWRWAFYSCNGFHETEAGAKLGGIQPLWRDVLYCHQQRPIHVMLGGGDQIYNDTVWQSPALVSWTKIEDPNARLAHPFTQDMVNQVFEFYFRSYLSQWSQSVFSDALHSIPQLMVWDDHDIFDGWGSYPSYLQSSAIFQGVYFIARKFYALFQHHTTVERAHYDNGVFGEYGWNIVTSLGPTTALLALDTRSERTTEQIIRPLTWAMIQQRLAVLPPSTRHLVVLAPVPVIYPKIPILESALHFLSGLCAPVKKAMPCHCAGRSRAGIIAMMQKTGLADSLMSQFQTIDILDDLVDHWSADSHMREKAAMVQMLQQLALARGVRVTFISGDVHVAGVGRFMSSPKRSLRADHRYMPQIISSAIGNAPPPAAVVKALSASARAKDLDGETREMMVNVFGVKDVVRAARNYVICCERAWVPGAPSADGALVVQFRVEHPQFKETRPELVEVVVPTLELPMGPTGQFAPHMALTAGAAYPPAIPGKPPTFMQPFQPNGQAPQRPAQQYEGIADAPLGPGQVAPGAGPGVMPLQSHLNAPAGSAPGVPQQQQQQGGNTPYRPPSPNMGPQQGGSAQLVPVNPGGIPHQQYPQSGATYLPMHQQLQPQQPGSPGYGAGGAPYGQQQQQGQGPYPAIIQPQQGPPGSYPPAQQQQGGGYAPPQNQQYPQQQVPPRPASPAALGSRPPSGQLPPAGGNNIMSQGGAANAPPGSPAWLLAQSATPGTFMPPQQGAGPQQQQPQGYAGSQLQFQQGGQVAPAHQQQQGYTQQPYGQAGAPQQQQQQTMQQGQPGYQQLPPQMPQQQQQQGQGPYPSMTSAQGQQQAVPQGPGGYPPQQIAGASQGGNQGAMYGPPQPTGSGSFSGAPGVTGNAVPAAAAYANIANGQQQRPPSNGGMYRPDVAAPPPAGPAGYGAPAGPQQQQGPYPGQGYASSGPNQGQPGYQQMPQQQQSPYYGALPPNQQQQGGAPGAPMGQYPLQQQQGGYQPMPQPQRAY